MYVVLNKKHFHHGHVPRITTNSCMLRLLVIYSQICLGIYLEVWVINFFLKWISVTLHNQLPFLPTILSVSSAVTITDTNMERLVLSLEPWGDDSGQYISFSCHVYWKVFELHIFQVLETNSTFHGKNRATLLQRHKSVCWQMVVKRKNAFWKHVKRFWPQSVTVQ